MSTPGGTVPAPNPEPAHQQQPKDPEKHHKPEPDSGHSEHPKE